MQLQYTMVEQAFNSFVSEISAIVPAKEDFINSFNTFAEEKLNVLRKEIAFDEFMKLNELLNKHSVYISLETQDNSHVLVLRLDCQGLYGKLVYVDINNPDAEQSFVSFCKFINSFIGAEEVTLEAIATCLKNVLIVKRELTEETKVEEPTIEEAETVEDVEVVEPEEVEEQEEEVVEGPKLKDLREQQAKEVAQAKQLKEDNFIKEVKTISFVTSIEMADKLLDLDIVEETSVEDIDVMVKEVCSPYKKFLPETLVNVVKVISLKMLVYKLNVEGRTNNNLSIYLNNDWNDVTNGITLHRVILIAIVLAKDEIVNTLLFNYDLIDFDTVCRLVHHFLNFDEYKSIIAGTTEPSMFIDAVRVVASLFSKYSDNIRFYENTVLIENPPLMPDTWTNDLAFIKESIGDSNHGICLGYDGIITSLSVEFDKSFNSNETKALITRYINDEDIFLVCESIYGHKLISNTTRDVFMVISPNLVVVYHLNGSIGNKNIVMVRELRQTNIVEIASFLTAFKFDRENNLI